MVQMTRDFQRGQRLFSLPPSPDGLWDTSNIISKVYRSSIPIGKTIVACFIVHLSWRDSQKPRKNSVRI